MTEQLTPRIVRTRAAAAYLGLAARTLDDLRASGTGPRYVQLTARSVGYDVADLDAWIEARKRGATSEPAGGAR